MAPPPGHFFLLGIRGVGKSTWTKTTFPEAHVVDLLDERRYHALLADPAAFGRELAAVPAESTVVVDEIQDGIEIGPLEFWLEAVAVDRLWP